MAAIIAFAIPVQTQRVLIDHVILTITNMVDVTNAKMDMI